MLHIFLLLLFFPARANYRTKIGPTGLRVHECHCWGSRSTITAAHDVMPVIGGYKAGSTTFWNDHGASERSCTMYLCKYDLKFPANRSNGVCTEADKYPILFATFTFSIHTHSMKESGLRQSVGRIRKYLTNPRQAAAHNRFW